MELLSRITGGFRDEVDGEEGGRCTLEIVANKVQLHGHTHDSSILLDPVSKHDE